MTQPDIGCNALYAIDSLHRLANLQDLLQLTLETENTNPERYLSRLQLVLDIYLREANEELQELKLNLELVRKGTSHRRYR